MTQVQLPPKFKCPPEVATGTLTLKLATILIYRGDLTYEGACILFPPHIWPYLPQPVPSPAQGKRSQRWNWLEQLRKWRKTS
jgi:hypothetical protein